METSVCICGAGTMGRGIAIALAASGFETILFDPNTGVVDKASSLIEKELNQEVERKRMQADEKKKIIQRINFTTSISDCRGDIIIEAILEDRETKSALFLELNKINSPESIFATNTSSISVTEIAEKSSFDQRIIGLHFFNPANRMKLVEIIRTKYNADWVVNRIIAFAKKIGKTPVLCTDSSGFIVNRVARPFYLESLRLAEQEIADISSVDKLMESAGFKMGPFHLMDLIGIDINYSVSCSLYNSLKRPDRLKPSTLQESLVKKETLGRKTGSGFFQYAKSENA
jgi:3-hydroxybutyryl-CoA dehydrogenase